jgi:tetratricopeptide (TPR) repeat protein
MKLCSWTLVGPGREVEMTVAVASVRSVVDCALVIDTAPRGASSGTPRRTRHLHHRASTAAPGLSVRSARSPWPGRFDEARNDALRLAAGTGATWGAMLDSDEQIVCPDPGALRAFLAGLPPEVDVVIALDSTGLYGRERFFRLPARTRFRGRTHEMYSVEEGRQRIVPREVVSWSEAPKTHEQLRVKWERDIPLLRADIDEDPKDGRAWLYLGISLQGLGQHEEAVEAFQTAASHDPGEGGAWACFLAGESLLALERPGDAVAVALAGMARDAGIAELPWLAGIAEARRGRPEQARCWAELAKVHGAGSAAERRRVGFRHIRGLTVGPGEVVAWAAKVA